MATKRLKHQEQGQARPCRPFTPYNIFFHLEKERILQEQGRGYAAKVKTIDPIDRVLDTGASHRPTRYQHLVLPVDWYMPDPGKKRRLGTKSNRAPPHGIVTFVELSKMISSEWKVIDEETKNYCIDLADEQLRLYNKEMKAFVEKYGAKAAKRSSMSKVNRNKSAAMEKKITKKARKEGGAVGKGGKEGEEVRKYKLGDGIPLATADRIGRKRTAKGKKSDHNINFDKKNGISVFHLRRNEGIHEGLQDEDYNLSSKNTISIEPVSIYLKTCSSVSPILTYWANEMVNGTLELSLDSSMTHTGFCSKSSIPSPQVTPQIEQDHFAANKINTDGMKLWSRDLNAGEHSSKSEHYVVENSSQVCNIDINEFDWNRNPNPSFQNSFASVPSMETLTTLQHTYHGQGHDVFPFPSDPCQASDQPNSLKDTPSQATGMMHNVKWVQELQCFTEIDHFLCREIVPMTP